MIRLYPIVITPRRLPSAPGHLYFLWRHFPIFSIFKCQAWLQLGRFNTVLCWNISYNLLAAINDNYKPYTSFFLQVGNERHCYCTSRCCLCYGEAAAKAVQRGTLSGESERGSLWIWFKTISVSYLCLVCVAFVCKLGWVGLWFLL